MCLDSGEDPCFFLFPGCGHCIQLGILTLCITGGRSSGGVVAPCVGVEMLFTKGAQAAGEVV